LRRILSKIMDPITYEISNYSGKNLIIDDKIVKGEKGFLKVA
jgi:ATP-dependent protease HslVU (ClpYQ) ATPase subunit